MIDWTQPTLQVSRHFTVKEAIWLPSYGRLACAGDGLNDDVNDALLFLFAKMDIVRDFVGVPINVHCAYRPHAYNLLVKGAPDSAHIARIEDIDGVKELIAACDWSGDVGEDSVGENCDTIRAAITPKLEEWGMSMEDNPPGSPWIHLDTAPIPGFRKDRVFKP